jgi:hypothetical protein
VSAGVTAAGGLLQGVGQYEAGQTRSNLFRANASIATAQGESEAEAGATNASMIKMRGAAVEGQQVAAIGANNLQQTGTNANVVASTAAVNEMDALNTRNNAMRRAWGFEVQGASDAFQEKQASSAGDYSAAGSILAGGAKAYKEDQTTGSFF